MKNRIGRGVERARAALAGNQQEARRQAKEPGGELERLRRENARLRERSLKAEAPLEVRGGVRPENVVWILGSGRTGSSWLSFMMEAVPNHARWNEPLVGYLFAHVYYERGEHRLDERYFILGDDYKDTWLAALRSLVLDGADARFPEAGGDGYVVIKEPHGSRGAPFLMEALPESCMIFLVRDPRDVAISTLKATWAARQGATRPRKTRLERALQNPDAFIKTRARTYAEDIKQTKLAYDAHEGPKTLVRYEELRTDTLGTMKRLYADLGIPVDKGDLARAVEEHAWESIPEEAKGEGKGRRKATPGGWREDLTPEQASIVEAEAAEVLEQFYPEDAGQQGG